MLNHEGESMDITQAPGSATIQTKRKIYAGEHLNQTSHYNQKVKVKTVRTSSDSETNILQHMLI